MSKSIFRIIERATGKTQGVYQRGNYDQTDFCSEDEARRSNVHGIYQDKDKYAILEFEVTEKCIGEAK